MQYKVPIVSRITVPTILMIISIEANQCDESLPTVQNVTHCPRNDYEWQLAVKRKRCDALASIQTCVHDRGKFVYHCLVNKQADGLVEVCAPNWILTGYCGYYDTALGKIVNNVEKDCHSSSFITQCPERYNSSDSYKYQGCYETKIKREESRLCDDKNFAQPFPSEHHLLWILPGIIAIVSSIGFICSFMKLRKLKSKGNTRTGQSVGQEQRYLNLTSTSIDENVHGDQDLALVQSQNNGGEAPPREQFLAVVQSGNYEGQNEGDGESEDTDPFLYLLRGVEMIYRATPRNHNIGSETLAASGHDKGCASNLSQSFPGSSVAGKAEKKSENKDKKSETTKQDPVIQKMEKLQELVNRKR